VYSEQVAERAQSRANQGFYQTLKRAVDVGLSVLFLLLTFPIFLAVAILVKLDSPGPVFFRQQRVGQGNRPFTFYKFRTMVHNADSEVHRRYVQSLIRQAAVAPDAHGQTPAYKLARDPRITRVGHILRRTSLDELPQFINVLKGDMSIVGPRPPLPYEVQEYQDWHMARLAVLPGITGLWQVMGRSRVTFDEMVRMDLRYIKQQSLLLDFKIMVLTIPAILSGHGAM
jgi:exopolysaccharide biosynthesis polyprenyl glycosylphosphotransferase